MGIDVGSVSTNIVVADSEDRVKDKIYLRTEGRPIDAVCRGLDMLAERLKCPFSIEGVGATGSGRRLAAVIAGADIVKNEITAHAVAAQKLIPGVRTVMEIGGQDSKIIMLRNGIVYDFAMNTVCAAGTGSFLDRQASRLDIPIDEFGKLALLSKSPVHIAGRCAVFAESDMIHKQQEGHLTRDIIAGLCRALARNYLNNLAKSREILEPVVFQGGVAANAGIVKALNEETGLLITVPEHYDVMGACGAAFMARAKMFGEGRDTGFRGFKLTRSSFDTGRTECDGCSNRCEIIEMKCDGQVLARWGGRCGKWSVCEVNTGDVHGAVS